MISKRIVLIGILMLIIPFIIIEAQRSHHKRRRHVCVNGREIAGSRCECNPNFTGDHCERSMHCHGKSRNGDGSCKECEEQYYGESCDLMNCTHGTQDEFYQKCICEKPYSGDFCDTLLTADVYLYYNSKMVTAIGPLGALTIIPLFLIYYGCEFMAQKRQVKRIGEMMSDQNVTVDSQAVKNLLDE